MIVWSAPQPAAQLLVTHTIERHYLHGQEECPPTDTGPMVARYFTIPKLPLCLGPGGYAEPLDLVGQRIAIASTDTDPDHTHTTIADWMVFSDRNDIWKILSAHPYQQSIVLPLGCIVGSATVAAVYPIVEFEPGHDHEWPHICLDERPDSSMLRYPGSVEPKHGDNISDQLPYADWSPGLIAIELADAAPCQERCPRCWGDGGMWSRVMGHLCPVSGDKGHCDPISHTAPAGWSTWEAT